MTNKDNKIDTNWTILFVCWVIASISVLGSLFFSEIMNFAPCILCWYQRIFLFPLALILSVGLFPFDKNVVKFSIPLALAGWVIAFYHNLIYSGIIPENLQPCSKGVSCTEDYINLFGIFTIPMLSLISLSIILILLFILKRRFSK